MIKFSGAVGSTSTGTITLPLAGKNVSITLGNSATVTNAGTAFKSAIEAALPGVVATISDSSGTLGDIVTLSKAPTTNGSLEVELNDKLVKVDVTPPALSTINYTSTGPNVSRTTANSLTVAANATVGGNVSFKIGEKSFSVPLALRPLRQLQQRLKLRLIMRP